MSFFQRMGAPVGNTQNVAEYLFDKVAHVAFITLVLSVGNALFRIGHLWDTWPQRFVYFGIIAAVTYTVIGKLIWHSTHEAQSTNMGRMAGVSDFAFDLWCGLFTTAFCSLLLDPYAWMILVAWVLGVLAGSNNQWGEPS